MAIRLLGRGLNAGRRKRVWDRIFKALASIRGYDGFGVDSSTVEAEKGGSS
jgi:hypothetical protein